MYDRRTRPIQKPILLIPAVSIRSTCCPMSLRRTLEENVLGPFDANEVLDDYVNNYKNRPVDLHRLEVVRNGRPSG
jgi:hypothetical protein